MNIQDNLTKLKGVLPDQITLVSVSKTKPTEAILEAYEAGQRIFGENRAQELASKYEELPKDIEWHAIGHLQTNKVKYIAPFVSLIHAVDSLKLLIAINKEAKKHERTIACLLQIHIAQEQNKFGFSADEVKELLSSSELKELENIKIKGSLSKYQNVENILISLKNINDFEYRINENKVYLE